MAVQSELRFTFTIGTQSDDDADDAATADTDAGIDILADAFDVIEFRLTEGLSQTFLLDVQLSCANPAVDFAQVLDQNACLTLWQGGLPVRFVHGAITSFVQGDTGHRRTRYSAIVEPRLARLQLASDWRIFQTLTVAEIAQTVLKQHAISLNYEQRITNAHLPREYCVQAGDTDYHFVERILREEGFFYGFEHSPQGHRLIHCDRLWIFGRQSDAPVQYHPTPGGDRPQPALRRFAYTENVRTARQAQRDYDFKNPRYNHQTRHAGTDLERQGQGYERYDYPGRYKSEAGQAFTRDRLRGLRADARIAMAEGDDARLQPGIAFELTGHPRQDMNRSWRPVHIEHHGRQYTSQQEDSADAGQGTHYHSTATVVPDDAEWRAPPLARPRIDGPQQATVVGPPGEEIYCDEHGRVKVQFPWDRQGREDDGSSCWIRVAQNWAGARWGHMAIPRIGQEVIVDYFDGDCDQPIIVGRNYNGLRRPPYELPKFKTLATIQSREHKGRRASELRLDDTTKEISAALMNDHGASHLHLGYLTHPRPDGGAPRGEGFELRSDLHGALRAAQGLLLSTESQPQANGGQLDRAQLISTLQEALQLARNLGDYAGEHQGLEHDARPRQALTEAVDGMGHGANDQASGTGDGTQPVIALSAPAGIALGTPSSIALGAGQHLDGAAQGRVQLSSGERTVINAGNGLGTFAQSGDMRHIAHQGELLLQAQNNHLRIQAEQSVEISASQEHVLIAAEKHITLLCGGAYIKMSGGNIEMGMPGRFTVKADQHIFLGPASMEPRLPLFDAATVSPLRRTMKFSLATLPNLPQRHAGEPFTLLADGAPYLQGVLDPTAGLRWEHREGVKKYTVELVTGQRFDIDVQQQFSDDKQIRQVQKLSNRGFRSHEHQGDSAATDNAVGDAFRHLLARFHR